MNGYSKLAASIVTSSIWTEADTTRIVWITMLAIADMHGEVNASIPGLARVAGVSVEACETAIRVFLAPDPYSRTKDDEGRRIEVIDGGWVLLNHRKYRELATGAEKAANHAKRQQRYRAKHNRNAKGDALSDASGVTGDVLVTGKRQAATEAATEAATNTNTNTERVGVLGIENAKTALGRAFKRDANSPWTYAEESALLECVRRPSFHSELDLLLVFKSKPQSYFPQSISRLLSDWPSTVDRARNHKEEVTAAKPLSIQAKEMLAQRERLKNL